MALIYDEVVIIWIGVDKTLKKVDFVLKGKGICLKGLIVFLEIEEIAVGKLLWNNEVKKPNKEAYSRDLTCNVDVKNRKGDGQISKDNVLKIKIKNLYL